MRNRIVTAIKQRFSIRKLSIGAASVLLGTSLYFMGGSATIVHADTTVSGNVPQTKVKDPVDVAAERNTDGTIKNDDTTVNQAIDDYANQKQEEQDKAGNKVIIRPSDKQPVTVNTAKERADQVRDIIQKIDDDIETANQDRKIIDEYNQKHNNQKIINGKDSDHFENQSLSVDDEKGSEINKITVTDDKDTTKTTVVDGESKNIDGINITHTGNMTDKEQHVMKINSNNKVIVDFHDQCQGKEITVTYDNLNNSYYLENETNRIKISRIDRTFSSIQAVDDNPKLFNPNGKDKYKNDAIYDKCDGPQLIIYNDPSDGFFYNNIKQISVKDIYYDDKGHEITFNDKNPAWIFVTSLNSNGWGNIEKVRAQGPDNSSADIEKIAGSTVTGPIPVDENTTKEFTRTVELADGHSNGVYLRNYLRTNADNLKNQGWNWEKDTFKLTQTVTLHVKKTKDGYVYDNENAFFKGLNLPSISDNGTEKYPDIEIPEVRVSSDTARRIQVNYGANFSTKSLDETKVGVDEEKAEDPHDGWWYSDESNNPQNNYPDWDNKSEDNRYAFVGAVAIKYQPGMPITYGADDHQWGSHWACMQTQVVSSLNENVIIYDHIKDGVQEVTPDNPGKPGEPINPNDPDGPKWPAGTDEDGLSKDVTEHITYTGLPATETPAEVTHVLKFTGSGYLDKVTGKWTDKDGKELEDQSLDKALEWTAQEGNAFDEVPSPNKDGYYISGITSNDQKNYNDGKDNVGAIPGIDQTYSKNPHAVIEIEVNYAKKQAANVIYRDVNDPKKPITLETSEDLTGKSDAKIDYDPTVKIQAYESKGYELEKNGLKGGVFFDNDDSTKQTFYIDFIHKIVKVTQKDPDTVDPNKLSKDVTEHITYTGLPATETPAEVTHVLKFTGSGYLDKVTGKWTDKDGKELEDQSLDKALEWTAQEGNAFDEVPSPSKAGYYVARVDVKVGDQQLDKDTDEYSAYTDGKDVKAVENITHNHENIVMTVIYAPCQKAGLTIIDENTGNHLGDYSDTGKSGKDIAFTGAKDAVDAYLKAGYIWDSAKNNADKYEGLKFGKLDKDASKDQNWTIYLKHGKVTVTPDNPGHPDAPINPNDPDGPKWPAGTDKDSLTKTGTQTIHYVGAGDKTPADNTQTYAFIKNMVIDKVTGKVLDPGSWNIDSYTFGTVKTPVIPGYHADKAVAGGETVTPDDLNKVITVTYAPDGNPGNPSDHGDTPSPEPTPEPETTPNPTPDDQPDSETSSDEHFEKVEAKDKLDKTNPKKVDAYKKQRKIIKTKIAKQGHTEIAEPIEDKVTRENNVKVVSDPVENKAAEPKLPQTGEADNSIIGLLGMLLASFAAMFGFDSLHSHDKKHKN